MDKKSSVTLAKILAIILSVLVVHLCSIVYYFYPTIASPSSSPAAATSTKTKTRMTTTDKRAKLVIIDTDAGGDDAVAILLALKASEELRVVAITCVYGNTGEENVETNVRKILTIAGKHDEVPVYGGAKKPLLQNYTAGDYFGKDGLGDFEFGREILGSVDGTKHAALAMIDLVDEYPGEIDILTLGPLTNVALAASLDPDFTRKVKRFYVMGGTVEDETSGDPEAEFNFSLDPESDAVFLESLAATTTSRAVVAPWDVVVKNKISKDWRENVLGKLSSDAITFLNKVESKVLNDLSDWYPADSIAVATMIWPDMATRSLAARISVRTCGDRRGTVVVAESAEAKNVDVVRDLDVERFKEVLVRYLVR